jgi:hypothetical protein
VVLLALGIPILIGSLDVKEYRVRYDDSGIFSTGNRTAQQEALFKGGDNGVPVTVTVTVSKTMNPPVSKSNCPLNQHV